MDSKRVVHDFVHSLSLEKWDLVEVVLWSSFFPLSCEIDNNERVEKNKLVSYIFFNKIVPAPGEKWLPL